MNKKHKMQEPATISWEKEGIIVALTQGDLQAIADRLEQTLEVKLEEKLDKKLDQKFKTEISPIYERLDRIDGRLDRMDERLDRMDERLNRTEDNFKYLDVKLNKTIDKLESLDLSFRHFAQSTKKDIAKLQDGMDTVTEILRINQLIPGNT